MTEEKMKVAWPFALMLRSRNTKSLLSENTFISSYLISTLQIAPIDSRASIFRRSSRVIIITYLKVKEEDDLSLLSVNHPG